MSHKSKIILLIIFVLIIISVGAFWIWYEYFSTQAETIFGCQNTSAISSVIGPPGANLTTYNLFGHDITVNQIITPSLDKVQIQVNTLKTGYTFEDIQTYNSRSKRGGGGLSLHSYGIAIDINPPRNPRQAGKRDNIQTDIPASIIDVFHKNGFQWGGDWVGEADPMHFEWYGDNVFGSVLDSQSSQKVTDITSATIDGDDAHVLYGDYNVALDSINPHKYSVSAKGYATGTGDINLTCFQNVNFNMLLTPLPSNTPGIISGKVSFSGNRPLLIPANIYLDGKIVAASSISGVYNINNVRGGAHNIEARILMFPGNSVSVNLAVGENMQNINIVIGK